MKPLQFCGSHHKKIHQSGLCIIIQRIKFGHLPFGQLAVKKIAKKGSLWLELLLNENETLTIICLDGCAVEIPCIFFTNTMFFSSWPTKCVYLIRWQLLLMLWSSVINVCFRSDCSCSFTSFVIERLLHIEEHVCLRSSDSMLLNSRYPGIITFIPVIV